MLLVDAEADQYFKSRGETPRHSDPSTVRIECPDVKPEETGEFSFTTCTSCTCS